jgi:hypothetical protein
VCSPGGGTVDDRDVRRDHPSGLYRYAFVPVSLADSGDVMARALVRWFEIRRSLRFLHEELAALPEGPLAVPLPPARADACAVGHVEGWRGEIVHVTSRRLAARRRGPASERQSLAELLPGHGAGRHRRNLGVTWLGLLARWSVHHAACGMRHAACGMLAPSPMRITSPLGALCLVSCLSTPQEYGAAALGWDLDLSPGSDNAVAMHGATSWHFTGGARDSRKPECGWPEEELSCLGMSPPLARDPSCGVENAWAQLEPAPFAVQNTSRFIGSGRWDWAVRIVAEPAVMSSIECVEYMLHPTFPNPIRTVCGAGSSSFALSDSSWGEFPIGVKAVMRDGRSWRLVHRLTLH